MNLLRLLLIVFVFTIAGNAFAQSNTQFTSTPTDLKETGWNKVLCMKNGNTVLLHMEPGKRIMINVYDSTHKQVAHQEHLCRIVDIYFLKDIFFKGLYDINGEAVLFLEQEKMGKNGIIRLRFKGSDGTLIEENLIAESQNITKRSKFRVAKNKDDDSYALMFSTDVHQYKESFVNIMFYNKDHVLTKTIPLEIQQKKYDYLDIVGFESQPNGTCITLSMSKIETYGTSNNSAGGLGVDDLYDHDLNIFYIPKDSNKAFKKVFNVTTDLYPFYTNYTYNSFSKALNLLLFSYKDIRYQFGIDWQHKAITANVFVKLDENTLDLNYNIIANKLANDYLKQKTDTNHNFVGLPIHMFTNENGLSTLVSQSYNRFTIPETKVRTNYNTYLENICITQFDDDGKEIWGTVLPCAQYNRSYTHYYDAFLPAKRWQEQAVFGDLPEQVYNRQFFSLNTYSKDRNLYIIYNDYNKNFHNSIDKCGDTVYDYSTTNTCYYKMNRKKEITKNYVFGTPVANEYISAFIEGADFDEQRGVYATLVQYRKKDKVTLCMAWSKLE